MFEEVNYLLHRRFLNDFFNVCFANGIFASEFGKSPFKSAQFLILILQKERQGNQVSLVF